MSRFRRRRTDTETPAIPDLPGTPDGVLQVCHPEWRGVRSSALAFADPVAEAADLRHLIPALDAGVDPGTEVVVIQGWPPGAEDFARAAAAHGLRVMAVSHSAPSQHGVDAGEAEALSGALALQSDGIIDRVGVVKAGVAAALASLGHSVDHVPNRVPAVRAPEDGPSLQGRPVGVFLFPMWRKNVTTQLLAAAELGWTPHVMADPGVPYLTGLDVEVHGELDPSSFLRVFSAMHMNFNVTLSECHPMMPMESYRLGVPCLMSQTSDLFRAEPELHALTTVVAADEPAEIASAARRLDARRDEAVEAANRALDAIDRQSEASWRAFTGRAGTTRSS